MNILIGTILLGALAFALLRTLRARAPEALPVAFENARNTMIFMVPRLFVGLIGAGFMAALLPVEHIEAQFGEDTGFSGIALASLTGAATPGGPFVAFAMGAVALKAGASYATVLAYAVAWCIVSVNRSVAWELPVLGTRFMLVRWAISAPAPFILGGLVSIWA